MSNFRLLAEILRGEWLLHNPEAYYEFAESLRKSKELKFESNYKVEERSLSILDSSGNVIPSEKGNVTVPKNSIAQVSIQGELLPYSDWCTMGSDEIVRQLYRAQDLNNVDATLLRINTPGGSTQCATDFLEFKQNKTKPVVGLVRDALSLGYLAAVGCCDYIMMDGDFASRVGSIGVVGTLINNKKYLEAQGIEIHEIYPPESNFKNKDALDAREGNYKGIIKNSLSPLAVSFQNIVIDGRPNLVKEEGVLNGAVYFAKDALRLGLIDGIGNTKMAIAKARELALQYAMKGV